jgi:ribosomal protein S18 acetylase RimI-like enzyme
MGNAGEANARVAGPAIVASAAGAAGVASICGTSNAGSTAGAIGAGGMGNAGEANARVVGPAIVASAAGAAGAASICGTSNAGSTAGASSAGCSDMHSAGAGERAAGVCGTGSAGELSGRAAGAPGGVGYSFIIRKAAPGDAQSIHGILQSSFAEYIRQSGISAAVSDMVGSLDGIRRDIARIDVFIACMDDVPVGTVRVEILDGETALLTKLGVMAGYGNIGIGKSLLNLVDKVIAARGVRTLCLYTASKNTSLMRFYYGRGFYADSTTKDKGYIRALMKKDYAR